jgi:putative transposase
MGKLEIQTSKEASWSEHLARQAMSGKSIAAFCRDEAISVGNFYAWRTKLRDKPAELPVTPGGVTFIDLGAVTGAIAPATPEHAPPPAPPATSSLDIRIDLGGGVVLTIARR